MNYGRTDARKETKKEKKEKQRPTSKYMNGGKIQLEKYIIKKSIKKKEETREKCQTNKE